MKLTTTKIEKSKTKFSSNDLTGEIFRADLTQCQVKFYFSMPKLLIP